jgi:hypothetical protein
MLLSSPIVWNSIMHGIAQGEDIRILLKLFLYNVNIVHISRYLNVIADITPRLAFTVGEMSWEFDVPSHLSHFFDVFSWLIDLGNLPTSY